jgi:uncharacterized protein (DUF58 family)
MSRTSLLSLLLYALLLAALFTLHGELLLLAIPLVVYLLAGFLRAPEGIRLGVTRHLSAERVTPDGEVEVTVIVTNLGGTLEEALVEDVVPSRLTVRDGSPRGLVSLLKGASYTLTYTVAGPRGGYAFETLRVKVNDHLALAGTEAEFKVVNQLFVFPPLMHLRHIPIRPRRTRVYAGSIPARAGGVGAEFFGVRDYQPGDSPRAINWRASARHEDLYSNEFQQERVSDVGIVLDGRLRTNAFGRGHSLFEYSVTASAALADAFLAQGNRVGLLLYANYLGWTLPAYGKVQRERILQALARAQTGESQVFSALEHIPTRLFPPESQIVVVSPLTEDDVAPLVRLRGLGYQVMVISPDPISFETSYLSNDPSVQVAARVVRMERALMLHNLQRSGVQTLNWDVTQPFDQVMARQLGRPPGWLRAVGR